MWKWSARLVSLAVGGVGLVDIVSALWPPAVARYRLLHEILPVDVLHASRTLTLIIGICLVVLAQNLLRRKQRAWKASLALLVGTLLLHLTKGLDIEEFLLTCGAIVILLRTRTLFFVQSDRVAVYAALKTSLVILAALFVYTVGGYIFMRTQFVGPYNVRTIPGNYLYESLGVGRDTLRAESQWARWFEGSINTVSMIAILLVASALFAPVIDRDTPSEEDRKRLQKLVAKWGQSETDYFALQPGKLLWFDAQREHVVAYSVSQKKCVVLGSPIGPGEKEGVAREFETYARSRGLGVVWYNLGKYSWAKSLGKKIVKIGESALIDTAQFTLHGAAMADVRHAVAHVDRLQAAYTWYSAKDLPWDELRDIDALYTEWVEGKKAPALTFSLGFYPLPVSAEVMVLVVRGPFQKIWAALSLFPVAGSGLVVDLMMRSGDSPNGVMEGAIVQAVAYCKNHDIHTLSLGMAPLVDTLGEEDVRLVKNIRRTIFGRFNTLYDYKSLYAFKNKFRPTWSPRYMYVDGYMGLPGDATAVVAVHLKRKR